MKILVIQQKMIGDVLASSIICNNLKVIFPLAQVDYLVYPYTTAVIENNPNVDNIVLFKEQYRTSKKAFFTFLKEIRRARYDIVIDAYGIWESNLIVAFSGAKRKVSFKKSYTRFLYTDTFKELEVPLTSAGLALENRMLLLSPFHSGQTLDIRPKVFLTQREIEDARALLTLNGIASNKKLYMIGLLGSGANKTYPAPYMANILDTIAERSDATLLVNYMPSQQNEAREILDLCNAKTRSQIVEGLIPSGIRGFLALTYHCDALIGNEGGAVNMAKALGKPTFTIFSTWIKKEAWNSFEDGTTTVSVHLKDFKPEVYGSRSAKEMKHEALKLYELFTPDLFKAELTIFLANN